MNDKSGDDEPQWRIYERFVALLQSQSASDMITVVPNARLLGAISGVSRQVDVLIDARLDDGVDRRIIVDAKRRSRKVDVKDVESFEGMMRDCRAQRGVLVCATGFTAAARLRAQEAITLSLVTLDEVSGYDCTAWSPCLGGCSGISTRTRGWVLYDQPFGMWTQSSPISVLHIGKCDRCHDFHVWCDECGEQFALRGNTAEYKCECDRIWFTAEQERTGHSVGRSAVVDVLLLLVPLTSPSEIILVDRRPLS